MSINPPFRGDVVGSFLRTDAIHQARTQHESGEMSADDLRRIEDREILGLIAKQRENGLPLVTDGEYRRAFWHFDFYDGLTGVDVVDSDHGIQFQGIQTKAKVLRITGKIAFPDTHPFLDAARFVLANAGSATVKVTIPSPTVLHFRLEPGSLAGSPYATPEDVLADLAIAYQEAVRSFYAIGVRYLQFDDTAWAYLCSETELAKARANGLNTDGLADRYAATINTALAAKPADMTITTHVCRGNFRSTWISSGGYEPVAKQLLADTNYDGYFLEYDSERAGGFEPLRFLPAGNKTVVLGLVTTKDGALESATEIKARISEASAIVPLGQLAVSPQCGFASTEEGNVLSEDQQWAKVRAVVGIAAEVWPA
jgi:5-methyltetrahydropteroyltriglutamate--homocysteine methyltransferase